MENEKKALRSEKGNCRFNIVDLFIIVCFLIFICAAVFVFDPFGWGIFGSEKMPIALSYTVCLDNIETNYVGKIQEGDTVLNADTKEQLGRVTAIRTVPQTVLQYDGQNTKMQAVPDIYSVFVTITADGSFTEKIGYAVGEKRIAVGAGYTLLFPNFSAVGFCTALEPK